MPTRFSGLCIAGELVTNADAGSAGLGGYAFPTSFPVMPTLSAAKLQGFSIALSDPGAFARSIPCAQTLPLPLPCSSSGELLILRVSASCRFFQEAL